jgi:hypothetical protein
VTSRLGPGKSLSFFYSVDILCAALTHAVRELLGVLGEVVAPAAEVGDVNAEAEALGTEADIGHGHVVVRRPGRVWGLHSVQLDKVPASNTVFYIKILKLLQFFMDYMYF